MGYMDFLEQRIIIIPPGMWSFSAALAFPRFYQEKPPDTQTFANTAAAGRCPEPTPLRTIAAKRRHQTPGTSCRKQSLGNRTQKTC